MLIWIVILIVSLVMNVPAWLKVLAIVVCSLNILWYAVVLYLTWKDKKEIENV